jgi:hypothetical protein
MGGVVYKRKQFVKTGILSVATDPSVTSHSTFINLPYTATARMPRVTRKEKELGKAKPKPKGAYESRNPKTTGGREGGKKTGFKVGPAHAPKDAYLGKGSSFVVTLKC